jgi:ribulose 1,5-bisphosphate carboxylase large subunit-like protein
MEIIFNTSIEKQENVIATYFLESKTTLEKAAWELAIGQSVGNPNVRNAWETDELFIKYSCKILHNKEELQSNKGIVNIAFPIINTNWEEDGISHLLCQLMGGQMDIDNITKCHLLKIDIPDKIVRKYFKKPKQGIEKIRQYTKCFNKPLLGGIVKPKTGISPQVLLEMVQQMVEGGVNFIKEDEILSNPIFCPIEERVPLIMNYLKQRETEGKDPVIYCVCINADSPYLLKRVQQVYNLGGNGIHVNFWCGMSSYLSIRKLTESFERPFFIHFQKSGDKILTSKTHDYHIDWKVICELAGLSGVDFIHAGMWGGYMSDDENDLKEVLKILHHHRVIPALSCGMHPGIVQNIIKIFGNDFMANCGGSIHGHPGGSKAGAKAMKDAINGNDSKEYRDAINKWGLIN